MIPASLAFVRGMTHILAISGSLRSDSYNTAALRAAQELAPDGMTIDIATLEGIPLYNADEEKADGLPDAVAALRERLAAADGLLVATPEYNYSIPGVLKNALDWLSRGESPLAHKPTAMLGAGGRLGTVRAQMHLRQMFLHDHMHVVDEPEVFIDRASQKFTEGVLTDERARDQIRRLLLSLQRFVAGNPTRTA